MHEYDVVIKMKIRTKENLSENKIVNSVEIALWGVELTTLTDASIDDLGVEVKKKQENKNVPV